MILWSSGGVFKAFLKNSVIYGLGRIGVVAFSFVTLPILTNHLSPKDYGIFDLLMLCAAFLNVSVAFEITQAIARFLAESEKENKSLYTSTGLYFSLLMYSLTSLGIWFFQKELSVLLFGSIKQQYLLVLLIPFFILYALSYFIQNQLRWENRPVPQVTLQILQASLFLFFIVLLIKKMQMGVKGAIYAHILSLSLVVLIGFFFLVYKRSIHLCFSYRKLKEMISFSLPLVPASLAVFAQTYIDRIMISKMLSLHDLGIYGFGFRVASILMLFIGAFQMSITPLIYDHYKKEHTKEKISQSFRFFLLCVLIGGIGICFFLPELFFIFVGSSFDQAGDLIPYLLFIVIITNSYVFAPGLAIAKKTKIIALINIGGMLLNIGLNFIMIRFFGLRGAVIATGLSALVVTIINFLVSQRYYLIPYKAVRIIIASILTVFCCLCFIYQIENIRISELNIFYILGKLGLIFWVMVVLVFSLFSLKEIAKAKFLFRFFQR